MSSHDFGTPVNTVFELIADGDYEVTVESIDKIDFISKIDGKSTFRLNVRYRIRDDVEQLSQNRIVFGTIFADANQEANGGWGDIKAIQSLLYTQKNLPNYQTIFEQGQDEMIQYITGRSLLIHVGKKLYTKNNGEEAERQTISNYRESKVGPRIKEALTAPAAAQPSAPVSTKETPADSKTDVTNIPDEDLPF